MEFLTEAEKLGKILEILRKNKNTTQTQLAKEININRLSYNKYENGKIEPSIATLKILANYYKVSVDYLIGNETNNILCFNVLSVEKRKAIIEILNNTDKIASKITPYIQGLKDREDLEIEPKFNLSQYEINKLREINERGIKKKEIE